MTSPSLPPGLSLSHLPARLALSTPPLLRLILSHLVALFPCSTNKTLQYPALCAASLVARNWADAAQGVMQRKVVFKQGDGQMRGWLEAVECMERRGVGVVNEEVRFCEKEEEVEVGEGKKWSTEVMGEVMRRVKGVKMLVFEMTFVKELPDEWLVREGLKDLTILATACPFAPPPTPTNLPFKLRQFTPVVALDNSAFPPAAWSNTFTLLSPTFSTLTSLDMEQFLPPPGPSRIDWEAHFFPSLFPCHSSLTTLDLPLLSLTPSSYRLALFVAYGLPALETLVISLASAAAIRELLPYFARFAPRLERVVFRNFRVPLGAAVVKVQGEGVTMTQKEKDQLLEYPDPAAALVEVLTTAWPTKKEGGRLELVLLLNVRIKEPDVDRVVEKLRGAIKRVGAGLFLQFEDDFERGLSEDETARLSTLRQRVEKEVAKRKREQDEAVRKLLATMTMAEEGKGKGRAE